MEKEVSSLLCLKEKLILSIDIFGIDSKSLKFEKIIVNVKFVVIVKNVFIKSFILKIWILL